MDSITLFSWGYWGWGNATRQLVEAVDAEEGARGFRPPLFVDARISRSVRAVGFRERAFEQLVGTGRYRWMRGLGNRHVETRIGPRIQIADPAAADELVDLAIVAAEQRRRVLFFCSCEHPIHDGEECHRVEVARLARAAAQTRTVPLRTVEWPGTDSVEIDLEVPRQALRAVQRGRASLPLDDPQAPGRLAGLGWASIVRLRSGDDELRFASGPARFQGGWCLPVLRVFVGSDGEPSMRATWAREFRRAHGYEAATGSVTSVTAWSR